MKRMTLRSAIGMRIIFYNPFPFPLTPNGVCECLITTITTLDTIDLCPLLLARVTHKHYHSPLTDIAKKPQPKETIAQGSLDITPNTRSHPLACL
ncbi:hypothetical protein RHGRI_007544 [Rhododendron griersonianum]|uniref:Uncharacterized protein n=1 Tax=Rhododendron griersonianum TaxID=479676 RepID=A0AAV6KXY6_9ERIC|nr:hypothetical protein RHGRI_007544 [Rhododendron griersonianum]